MNDKINWAVNDWFKIIWSDESRFALRHNDGGVRVIRKFGERLHKQFVLSTFKLYMQPKAMTEYINPRDRLSSTPKVPGFFSYM